MRMEAEVGWYLTAFVPVFLLRSCFVYGEPALVQASHLFSTADADTSQDALNSYMSSVAFDFTGVLPRIVFTAAFVLFLLCLTASMSWFCAENSKSTCCAATARRLTCGKMGSGMRSAVVHRPERFLPVFSNTYRQFVPDELDVDLTDIERRDGWVDAGVKLPGTRIENRCFTRVVSDGEAATVAGEQLPPGNSLATWQLSVLQGHLVSYALQDHPVFGPAAQPLAAAACSDGGILSDGLRACLAGEAWHDWPDESERAPIPTLRSDNTFEPTALLEYQEHYRRSRRQEFASSTAGRLFGRKLINAADRKLNSCQLRTGCCMYFKPFDITMQELRRIAPRETDALKRGGRGPGEATGAAAPLSPPKRVGATGILVLPRHPDDSDSDDEPVGTTLPPVAAPGAKGPPDRLHPAAGGKRQLPPLLGRGSSKVASTYQDEFLL